MDAPKSKSKAVHSTTSPRPNHGRVVGLDPGLLITGYAVLERSTASAPRVLEAGVIRGGRAERPLEIRLARLHAGLVELLETFRPTTIAVEQVHSQMRRPLAAVQLAHARGVLVLAAGQRGISVVGYSATGVKRTLTGNGRASKDQVQNAIRIELGLDSFPQPSDVADACALALCHLAQEAGRQRLAEIG